MSSTSLVRSGYSRDWSGEPSSDRRRSSGGFSRFIVSVGIGIGGTLAWQAYGDTAREMLAGAYPQLNWVAPRAAAQTTGLTSSVAPSSGKSQEFQELSIGLAAMRQRVDQLSMQLATSQEQMSRDIAAKVQTAHREILDKIAATQRPEVTAARKPPATPAQQSTQIR